MGPAIILCVIGVILAAHFGQTFWGALLVAVGIFVGLLTSKS